MDDGYLIQPSFQSTHPVWGGTEIKRLVDQCQDISIHPPRVGWDDQGMLEVKNSIISIHPPRVGWDGGMDDLDMAQFLISIHPPRVGWDPRWSAAEPHVLQISIHPPRVGWDFFA